MPFLLLSLGAYRSPPAPSSAAFGMHIMPGSGEFVLLT